MRSSLSSYPSAATSLSNRFADHLLDILSNLIQTMTTAHMSHYTSWDKLDIFESMLSFMN